jgi:hypothetical protein
MLDISGAWADGAVESDFEAIRDAMRLASSVLAGPPSRRSSILALDLAPETRCLHLSTCRYRRRWMAEREGFEPSKGF